MFIGRNDAEAETAILWPLDADEYCSSGMRPCRSPIHELSVLYSVGNDVVLCRTGKGFVFGGGEFPDLLVLLVTDRILAVMLFASLIQLGRSKSAVSAKVKAD